MLMFAFDYTLRLKTKNIPIYEPNTDRFTKMVCKKAAKTHLVFKTFARVQKKLKCLLTKLQR